MKKTVKNTTKKSMKQRAIVVVDRGWIFAGDVTDKNGRVLLANAVHVFKWSSIGFSRIVDEWNSGYVDVRRLSAPVDLPVESELFRIPVPAGWGLK